jgi:hypothetical protein
VRKTSAVFPFLTILAVALVAGMTMGAAAPTTSGPPLGQNLLQNPGAEAGAGSKDGSVVPVPSWTTTGHATAVLYGSCVGSGCYPSLTDPGPKNRGLNFFCGGASDTLSTATQDVDLSAYAQLISQNKARFRLSGWLGGFSTQADRADVKATFFNGSTALNSVTIGPVTEAQRAGHTGLLWQSADGYVPVHATMVRVVIAMIRAEGTANDGYADNISFSISTGPPTLVE